MVKIIIVGGVAGGATTAARLRRLDEKAEIIMLEKGNYISYANCGLPYYIGDIIKNKSSLLVTTADAMQVRYNIDVRINNEALSIDTGKKEIKIIDHGSGNEYVENYDKLVLSPGASPFVPSLPGIDLKGIFTIRTVDDTFAVKDYINNSMPKSAVVVGAGFIGLEMAESLAHLGMDITIIELQPQILPPLDIEMTMILSRHLESKKVKLVLEKSVTAFEETGNGLKLKLSDDSEIETGLVILSIGVRPESKLAKESDLEVSERGNILVDKFMQTSDADIYAVGDAISFKEHAAGKFNASLLAGPANKQARIAANNIIEGNKYEFDGTINTAIVKVFDLTAATTGSSEKVLKAKNIPYHVSYTHSASHAGYYPGAEQMVVKLLFAPENGRVLGTQIVGKSGVAKRIDVIAAIINQQGTIYDLQKFEQAYAPPYSSAKDPVNDAGFVAENILTGKVKVVYWDYLKDFDFTKDILLDVRTGYECRHGIIDRSINIPIDELRSRFNELPEDKKIIIYCAVGRRGYLACRILMQNGFSNVYNLSGGYELYKYLK